MNTILLGQILMQSVNDNRRQKWKSLVENMVMIRNSKKAWYILKQLNENPITKQHSNVTANQVAHPPQK